MKRLLSVLAAAAVASGLLVVGAYAAKEEAPKGPSAEQLKKGAAEAPAAVTASGLKCTIKNSAWLGHGETTIDKKKVKLDSYEVACDDGEGYMLNKFETGQVKAYNCVQVESSYQAAGKKGPQCILPENTNLNAQMQSIANAAGAKCTVNAETWVGGSEASKINRYEVGCTEGAGYLLDVPYEGAPKPAITCLQAQGLPYECKFTPKDARLAPLKAWAAGVDKSCTVTNGRWVGASEQTHHEFFEVACQGKPGFFVETDKGQMVKSIDCVRAQTIGGGCTLSDVAAAKAGAASSYASTLQANHINCTPTDFTVIGKEPRTGRDAVEFKCPEQPNGLVALIPGAGATGKFESFDCFGASERTVECSLTKKPILLGNLKTILTAIEKTCEPTEFQVHGPDDTDGDLVEVKCAAGQSGYILDLPPDRSKTIKTLSCEQASRGYDKCMIAGNK
jgi:hypothetical protein